MKYKQLILTKLEHLENRLRVIDYLYRTSTLPYEKNQVYDNMVNILDEIKTLINQQTEE